MNTLRQSTITGWGLYAPKRTVTNDELAQTIDTTDEWIQTRSGIRERHIVGPDEFTSTMSAAAGQRAMDQAGVTAADLDLILVATSTPDYLTPPVSSQVQDLLGAKCGAMALVVGCTGFVYAVVTAHQFIATGAAKTVLIIGAETITRNLNWEDRTTCVLFGDGAGAVVMQASEEAGAGVQAFVLGSDGSGAEHLIQYSGGTRTPPTAETIAAGDNYLRMNGREVFKFATTKMVQSLDQVLTEAGMTADDIDLFVPHQANARIIEYAAQAGRHSDGEGGDERRALRQHLGGDDPDRARRGVRRGPGEAGRHARPRRLRRGADVGRLPLQARRRARRSLEREAARARGR